MVIRGLKAVLVSVTALALSGCASDRGEDDDAEGALVETPWIERGCASATDEKGDSKTSDDKKAPKQSQRCDQGLFWFAKGNKSVQWRTTERNPNFDPAKPTIIYVHGWQNGGVEKHSRETFNYKANDPDSDADVNTADAWIDGGWNVGIYYWNRLADDPGVGWLSNPDSAEAKIWRTDGPTGMRWRKDDGTYETVDVPKKPSSELFFEVYGAAMRDFRGREVRIAGHSLGNQMAIRLANMASDAVDKGLLPAGAMPKRIALLDPYWTKQKVSDKRTGAARDVRDAVYMLARNGVAIEQYRTSSINDYGLGDDNPFVEENAAYTELYPNYFGFWNSILPWNYLRSDHRAAPNLYFWSFAFPPPNECNGKPAAGLSAAASNEAVRALMGPGRYWVQAQGQKTATPADDCVVMKTDERPALQPLGLFWERPTGVGPLVVHVDFPTGAHHARYFLGGHRAGDMDAARGGADFGTSLAELPNENEALLVASVYNEHDLLIGTTEDMIDLGDGPHVFIRQYGGMNFEVGLDLDSAGASKLELDVDGAAVTDVVTGERRPNRTAVRASYERLDGVKRTFVVRAYDSADKQLFSVERHFVLR